MENKSKRGVIECSAQNVVKGLVNRKLRNAGNIMRGNMSGFSAGSICVGGIKHDENR